MIAFLETEKVEKGQEVVKQKIIDRRLLFFDFQSYSKNIPKKSLPLPRFKQLTLWLKIYSKEFMPTKVR